MFASNVSTQPPIQPAVIPISWESPSGAQKAATGAENYARLIGFTTINVKNIKPNLVEELQSEKIVEVEEGYENSTFAKSNKKKSKGLCIFDSDGEFSTPNGQIPLSRLIDYNYSRSLTLNDSDEKMLQTVFNIHIYIFFILYMNVIYT